MSCRNSDAKPRWLNALQVLLHVRRAAKHPGLPNVSLHSRLKHGVKRSRRCCLGSLTQRTNKPGLGPVSSGSETLEGAGYPRITSVRRYGPMLVSAGELLLFVLVLCAWGGRRHLTGNFAVYCLQRGLAESLFVVL